jgi:hypothetical protein
MPNGGDKMLTMSSQIVSGRSYREKEWPVPGTSRSSEPPLQVPDHLRPVVAQLLDLLALGPGWNSYGARRIDPRAVTAAIRLLVQAGWDGHLPSISPTPQGGVQLEWGGQDDGVELLFTPDGAITALIDVNGEMREHEAEGVADPIVSDALAWAYELA